MVLKRIRGHPLRTWWGRGWGGGSEANADMSAK